MQAAPSCNASLGSILAPDDRLGVERSEALARRPEGFGGLGRHQVPMDECG